MRLSDYLIICFVCNYDDRQHGGEFNWVCCVEVGGGGDESVDVTPSGWDEAGDDVGAWLALLSGSIPSLFLAIIIFSMSS